MGIKLQQEAWKVVDLHHSEKYVLVAIAYYGDDNTKQAYISGQELADLTGISLRQIKRITKSLKDHGYLVSATGVFSKSLWMINLGGVQI